MIEKVKLEELIEKTITGEWGTDLKENEIGTKVIRTADFNNDGTINYDKVVKRNIENKKILDKKLTYGDIIVEKSGGTDKNPVGRVVFFDKKDEVYLANNFTQIIRINKEYNSKYIFYYLMYKYRNGSTNTMFNKTTGIQNLQMKQFLKQNITICDYEKQNNIVKALDLINNVFCIRKEQIEKLNELIKSQFVEMFGTINDNKNNYEIKTLNEIFEFIKDGTHSTPIYTDDKINGIKFLSAKDVTKGVINWENIKYIPLELHEQLVKRVKPQKDDILLAKNGTTGICAKVDKDEVFDIYVSLALLRPKKGYLVDYLVQAINNDMTKEQFDRSLKGVGVPNLHLGEIQKVKIIVPPIELQNKFAEFVKLIDKQKFEIEKSLKEMQELYESLMDKYFG